MAGLFFIFVAMNKSLIGGLGNIGENYAHTRHNIGFDVLDAFVKKQAISFRIDRLAEVAELKVKGRPVVCIKPSTYMNLSGKAVKYWQDAARVATENILVILDEVALPLDKLRIRPSGSSGGHNGLKSIEECLLTENYPRLRFGVGNNYPKGMQVEYVLGKWNREELPLVQKKTTICTELIEMYILQGIAPAMNRFNKLSITL
ncbi:MAG: aminoacyl-tRNA hydrolase [Chitinophagaceae bacterium]